MPKLLLYNPGIDGVNVDTSPLELKPTELTKAQNAVRDLAVKGMRNRPGLAAFNLNVAAGSVLGGIGVPFLNESSSGVHFVFVGRGPTS
jgi:hypothetical protein